MKILLDIGGWMKDMEIDPHLIKDGRVDVLLRSPMEVCIRPSDLVSEVAGCKVTLYYMGRTIMDTPIFEYK